MLARVETGLLEVEYRSIMTYSCGHPNDATFACMLSSWQAGEGILPADFGLGAGGLKQLLLLHFPGMDLAALDVPVRGYDQLRGEERAEVYKLLSRYRAGSGESETWMANIVAAACQGQDHLWQDMGLWSRDQLSKLMLHNFPDLALKNDKNMKWKKFIYKQLCITEGIYTCRAPSCEDCADYDDCFSPEE